MNILILCKRYYTGHDLLTDKFGRLYHFPHQWAKSGHTVKVLAADYKGSGKNSFSEENLEITATPLLLPRTGFFPETYRTVKKWRPDVIIASCDSHFGYIGSVLAEKLKVPFVFDLYHNYEDFGSNRLPGMRSFYNKALNMAELTVCDSEALAEKVASRTRALHIAPQATDAELFKPLDQANCRRSLKLNSDDRLLAYVGNVDSRFDREAVMTALALLAQAGLESKLLVAGPGLDKETIASPHVHYLGKLPQQQIPVVIGSSDICLIPYAQTTLAATCNPCKLSEYIACGRPIVASAISNISHYLPKSGHLCYEPGNPDSLFRAIAAQFETPIIEERTTALIWKDVAADYLRALEKLVAGQQPAKEAGGRNFL